MIPLRLAVALVAVGGLLAMPARAQTTLSPGDIVVIGYAGDDPDYFTLISTIRLEAGSTFKVTDNGVLAGGTTLRTGEGTLSVTTDRAIPAGTVLTFDDGEPSGIASSDIGNLTVSGSFPALNVGSGDQLILYQGDDSSPSFIYAFSTTPFVAGATNPSDTAIPSGLTNGLTAVDLTTEIDNAFYDDATHGREGTRAALLALVADEANYTTSNTRFTHAFPTFTVTDQSLTLTLTDRDGAGPRTGSDWRHVAVANAGTTYDDVLKDLWTQGFAGSDNPAAAARFCNAFTYSPLFADDADPDVNNDGTANAADGYGCLASQSAGAAQGTGVLVFGYDDQDGDAVLDLPFTFGTPYPALGPGDSFSYTGLLEYVTDPDVADDQEGFNDLGNVFAGDIDWTQVALDSRLGAGFTDLDYTVYVYDPGVGDFRTHTSNGDGTGTAGTPDDLPSGILPRGQGFFVRANGSGPELVVPASAVSAPGTPFYGRSANRPALAELWIEARVGGEAYGSDAFVWFHERAEAGYDPYDANRLFPYGWPYVATYTMAGLPDGSEAPLLGNALPPAALDGGPVTVPFGVEAAGFGSTVTVDLRFHGLGALPDGVSATLLDLQTGAETPVIENGTYAFSAAPSGLTRDGADGPAATLAHKATTTPRFSLVFSRSVVAAEPEARDASGIRSLGPNPARSTVSVGYAVARPGPVRLMLTDALGREIAVVADRAVGAGTHTEALDVAALPPGVYAIRLLTPTSTDARPLVIAR